MNVKKIRYIALALVVAAFCSCQKEPSTSDLHRDYLVYTAHDTGTDFAAIDTYYIPDSILIIGNSDKTEYWKDADAMAIIGTVVGKLGLHAHRGQRRRQRGHPAQLRPQSDLLRRL